MSVRFITTLFGLSSVVFLSLITIAVLSNMPCVWYLLTMGSINAFISYYLGIQAARIEERQRARVEAYHDAATFVESLQHAV